MKYFLLVGFLGVASASCSDAGSCGIECYDNYDAVACRTLCDGTYGTADPYACDYIYSMCLDGGKTVGAEKDGNACYVSCTDYGISDCDVWCARKADNACWVSCHDYDKSDSCDMWSCLWRYLPNLPPAGSCKTGCKDSTAFNYDASAIADDGSCQDVSLGCTNTTAYNYNANANTDDGSCVPVVTGCTNSTAFNYAASANTDDGSCRDVCGVPDGSSLCLKSNGGTLISETDEPGLMAAYSALKCEY